MIAITGSVSTLSGWTSGPCEDGSAISIHKLSDSYKGALTLKLQGVTFLNGQNDAVFHNYISADQSGLGAVTVTIDNTVNFNDKAVTSATYGSVCKGHGGVFKDMQGNKLLYPGPNRTNVT